MSVAECCRVCWRECEQLKQLGVSDSGSVLSLSSRRPAPSRIKIQGTLSFKGDRSSVRASDGSSTYAHTETNRHNVKQDENHYRLCRHEEHTANGFRLQT